MNSELTISEVIEISHRLINEFEKREQKKWNIEGNMIELSKQVGELLLILVDSATHSGNIRPPDGRRYFPPLYIHEAAG